MLQASMLFSAAIDETIACAELEVIEESILQTSEVVTQELVYRLRDGYNFCVAAPGTGLSGCDRQHGEITSRVGETPDRGSDFRT